MRMGRQTKKRRSPSSKSTGGTKKADTQNPNPPKFSSPTLVVGQVQSNVVSSVLAPALTEMAVRSVEEYADRAMLVEEWNLERQRMGGEATETKGAELDLEGNIVASSDHVPRPPANNTVLLFSTQESVDDFSALLTDTAAHFSSSAYKAHANAAKFERLLDERYGRLRPLIESHPQIEVVFKNLQRKYAMGEFSPFRPADKMPVSKTTAVMVLFMMHRQNVKFEALVLVALFCLVGLQPWALVVLIALGRWEMERRKDRKLKGMPKNLVVCEPYYAREGAEKEEKEEKKTKEEEQAWKYTHLNRPVGTNYNPADLSLRDEKHDVLLLGNGVETLYAAALLARAGKKVCVLSAAADISECAVMQPSKQQQKTKAKAASKGGDKGGIALFEDVPFDVKSLNISHPAKQQRLLAPALCTATDAQGGVRFARVGSSQDGYAHSILSVPGLGTDGSSSSGDNMIPVVINASGPSALAEYCATYLGDGFPGGDTDLDGKKKDTNDESLENVGDSTSLGYIKACRQINAGSAEHFVSKLFPASNKNSSAEGNAYRQSTIRPASAFLDTCLPLNPHIRSFMAAIGMANENLRPGKTCMAAHVSNLCAMTSCEGMVYPIGGPRALCHALASVVEQCGGRVVRGVAMQELLFDKLSEEKKRPAKDAKKDEKKDEEDDHSGPKPRCQGVRLQNGCEITVVEEGAVVSTLGLLSTFLHLLPQDVRAAHGVPPGLPAVSERRPLLKLLVGLRGTKEELNLTGADWYRLPNATLPRDELVEGEAGKVKPGIIGVGDDDDGEEEKAAAMQGEMTVVKERRGKQSKANASASETKKTRTRKFTSGQSWMKVSFPSAKDPSWFDRHGAISTCVITIEADDDFVRMFDAKPVIYSILNVTAGDVAQRLKDRVLRDLVENFPQLADRMECVQLTGPYRSGLVQNPARFAIKGNRPDTPYPGLYVGGSDLTLGDSFSGAVVGGWLAANAVAGYSFLDLVYLKKNLTSDLERFLEEPGDVVVDDESGEIVEDLAVPFTAKEIETKEEVNVVDDAPTNTAESSKEE